MISRRGFIKTVIAGALSIYSSKKVNATFIEDRSLNLYNIHTKENINIKYFEQGIYKPDALQRINHFLRCHFTNEVKELDVKLLDLLSGIHKIFGLDKQIHVVSGYRSLEYNEYLRSIGRRVSKNSLHLLGLAADIFIPGISNYELYKTAMAFEAGGVGHYSEFVHIDTGRKRYW
jgi:uncharacterized protein YcbK (DUF882 family)